MHFPGKCKEKPDKGSANNTQKDEVVPAGPISKKTRFCRQLFRTRQQTDNYLSQDQTPSEAKDISSILDNSKEDRTHRSESHNKSRGDLDLWEENQENFEEDIWNKYLLKMINLAREFAIFCFVLVAYAAITNDPPKVSKEPPAFPFFPKNSSVQDWYRGQISKAVEAAHMSDMTLVMFYAPWDAQSQEARSHFEVAANYLKDEVYFTAVNCWQPFGECKRQYSKVYRWPVFIAYPSHGRGVQYSGPITAAHLISFVQTVIKPLKRIENNVPPLDFREAFLVAELNCLPGSQEYGVYYVAALRYLEQNALKSVTFYVKPVQQSKLKLSLFLWHQVRMTEFDSLADFTVENILNWVAKELDLPTSWVAPTGAKSLALSERIRRGPSLMLFTPYNPLKEQNDYYDMLQEVAYEYKNCDDWGLNFDIPKKRERNLQKYKYLKKKCKVKPTPDNSVNIVSIVQASMWPNVSKTDNKGAKDKIESNTAGYVGTIDPLSGRSARLVPARVLTTHYHTIYKVTDCNVPYKSRVAEMCQNYQIENFGGIQGEALYEVICENVKRDFVEPYRTSMLKVSDKYSMANLAKALSKHDCRQFLAAEHFRPSLFVSEARSAEPDFAFQGLACKTNRSLSFVAMDSLLHHHFAEKLGIDLSKQNDESAVVIIDEKLESHFILRKPITVQNLKNMIFNYTKNHQKRSMASRTSVETKNTHFYSVDQDSGTFNDSKIIYVEEVFGSNFLKTVLQQNKAVVVFYYSKHCSYCSGISYMFLTISRKLAIVENLKFIRIDGDLNILPWEYTMERFPTILYFPVTKKSESRVFPPDLQITVPNLLGFLLANLDPPLRIQAMYSLCLQSQFREEKTKCLLNLRNETLSIINTTLRLWRKSNTRQKQVILHNLKQLRNLQLHFGHTSNNIELIQTTFRKFRSQDLQDYKLTNHSRYYIKDEL